MKANPISRTVKKVVAPTAGRKLSPCRILVVDHSSDLRLLYADALATSGCEVDVAQDSTAAWEALQARHYHLLVTENDPPQLAGEALIKKLRSVLLEVPVILASGEWPMREPPLNPSLPFAAVLRKPFVLETLRDTVQNVLRAEVPEMKHDPRGDCRPNLERNTLPRLEAAYENASQKEAVDFR